jgi:hypothetical protein
MNRVVEKRAPRPDPGRIIAKSDLSSGNFASNYGLIISERKGKNRIRRNISRQIRYHPPA